MVVTLVLVRCSFSSFIFFAVYFFHHMTIPHIFIDYYMGIRLFPVFTIINTLRLTLEQNGLGGLTSKLSRSMYNFFSCFRFYLFKLNLLGWPYRFQVYNSIKHHLHTASCAYHPKQISLCLHFPHLCPPPPSPILLSIWLSPHYCVCVLCIFVF